MSLYPPTAMRLLNSMMTTYSNAIVVHAMGERVVANHDCAAFQVDIDVARVGSKNLARYLYLSVDGNSILPYIASTTVDLCFDQRSGAILEYQNNISIDLRRMQLDGLLITKAKEMDGIPDMMVMHGGLLATRVE